MKRSATGLLVLGLLAAAPPLVAAADSKQEAIKKERMKFVGVWQVVSLVIDGNRAGEEDAKKITVVNGADGTWSVEVDGRVVERGTSEIDPTKTPKTIDATITEGDDKDKTALGIYELGDDERKLCLAKAGMERPADFTAPEGSGSILVVMKRLKK